LRVARAGLALAILLTLTIARGDVYGSMDHALVPRFEGSEILRFERKLSVTQLVLVRPLENPSAGAPEPHPTYDTLTGDLTRITYGSPPGAKLKEVYRYYEAVLQGAGFEPLYNCAGESCSPDSAGADFNSAMTPADAQEQMLGKIRGQRYLASKLPRGGNDVYASLYCVRRNPLAVADDERVYTNLVIVETR
jgi:OmpA-OmpF porin, OOP family